MSHPPLAANSHLPPVPVYGTATRFWSLRPKWLRAACCMLPSGVLLAPARSLDTSSAGPLAVVQYRYVYSCSASQLLAVCSSERVQWVRQRQSRWVFRSRNVSRCAHEVTVSCTRGSDELLNEFLRNFYFKSSMYVVGRTLILFRISGSDWLRAGWPGIESRWRRDFPHPSRPAAGPNQPPI
jgi:hypothetical protein